MNRHLATRILMIVGACVALALSTYYIAITFAWGSALGRLGRMDRVLFFGVGSVTLLAFGLLRTLRWRALLGPAARDVPLGRLYLLNVVAVTLAAYTPAQAGEVMKVELLKRLDGVRRWSGATSFVLERVADLIAALACAALGLAAHPRALPGLGSARPYLVPLAVLAGFAALIVLARVVRQRTSSEHSLPGGTLLRVGVASALAWCCMTGGWWVSAASVGVYLPPIDAFGLVGIVSLGSVLSLLPGGIGVAEALSSAVLERIGYSAADAQATALAIRAFSLLQVVIGLAHLAIGIALMAARQWRAADAPARPD